MKWRFSALFLGTFTVLVVLWGVIDIAAAYRYAALVLARALSPLVNGWWLDFDANDVTFRRGGLEMPMQLQLPALSMALMPLLSLIVATPRQGLRRLLLVVPAAIVLCLLIHVVIVLVYPLIMNEPNAFKDTVGVFSGLVAFVAGPLGLWFILTYPALRELWQIQNGPPADLAAPRARKK